MMNRSKKGFGGSYIVRRIEGGSGVLRRIFLPI
jgi:hypothetical protein